MAQPGVGLRLCDLQFEIVRERDGNVVRVYFPKGYLISDREAGLAEIGVSNGGSVCVTENLITITRANDDFVREVLRAAFDILPKAVLFSIAGAGGAMKTHCNHLITLETAFSESLKRKRILGEEEENSGMICISDPFDPWNGIIARLRRSCSGDVITKGLVRITMNDARAYGHSYLLERNGFVCFDFQSRRIMPISYSGLFGCTGSCVVEGSIDGLSWNEIDRYGPLEQLKLTPTRFYVDQYHDFAYGAPNFVAPAALR